MQGAVDKVLHLLVVDDNPSHVEFVEHALRSHQSHGASFKISNAFNGGDALQALKREGRHKDGVPVDLVLLDISMPGDDGFSVLRAIRTDPEITKTPVIMVTCSTAPEDRELAFREHANSYFVKPNELNEFVDSIQYIVDYWTRVCELPPRDIDNPA